MFYWLLFEQLSPVFGPARLFGYVTFRTAFASLTALFLSLFLGPWLIRRLREFKFGQQIREEVTAHQKKAGTPTMGGLLILISIVVPTLLWTNLRNPYVWIALFGLLSFGTIGFFDDYAKVKKQKNLGFTARRKFFWQVVASCAIGGMLLVLRSRGGYDPLMNVPFFKEFKPNLLLDVFLVSPWTYPLAVLSFCFW
jgi:phospho-N-acetylmuramoyl-pentapeptide-transferase